MEDNLNASIIDKIWMNGSDNFKQVVPDPSKAGLEATINTLTTNANMFNEFSDSLVTLIGTQYVNTRQWKNPLGNFKRINSDGGQTIQEIAFDLIKPKVYNINDNNLFEKNRMRDRVAYHSLNRQEHFDFDINKAEIRRAFNKPTGLSDYIGGQITTALNSDEYCEYLEMLHQITIYDTLSPIYNEQVPDISKSTATADDIITFMEIVKAKVAEWQFMSTFYNAFGVQTHTPVGKAVFVTTPRIMAKIDTHVLASAFHVSYAEIDERTVIVDKMPVNAIAMLADEDWFIACDTLKETAIFQNKKNLVQSNYLHHWSILSVSPMLNVVKFSPEETTNISTVVVEYGAETVRLANQYNNDKITLGTDNFVKIIRTVTNTPENNKLTQEEQLMNIVITAVEDSSGDNKLIENTHLTRSECRLVLGENVVAGDKIHFDYSVDGEYKHFTRDVIAGDSDSTPIPAPTPAPTPKKK